MEHKGSTQFNRELSWILMADVKFCEVFGYSLEESKGWEQKWRPSERAVQYGLDKPQATMASRAIAARQRRRNAKVAARRQQALAVHSTS